MQSLAQGHRLARITILMLLGPTLALSGCLDDSGDQDDNTPNNGDDGSPTSDFGRREDWYLHETGPCEDVQDQEFFMDKTDSSGDADFCGTFGAAPEGWTFSYPSTINSNGHASGATVTVSVFIQGANPGPVTMEWELDASGTVVASGTVEGTSVGPAAWVEMTDETTLEAEIPAGSTLTFEYTVPVAGGVIRGYEEDHASMFTLG